VRGAVPPPQRRARAARPRMPGLAARAGAAGLAAWRAALQRRAQDSRSVLLLQAAALRGDGRGAAAGAGAAAAGLDRGRRAVEEAVRRRLMRRRRGGHGRAGGGGSRGHEGRVQVEVRLRRRGEVEGLAGLGGVWQGARGRGEGGGRGWGGAAARGVARAPHVTARRQVARATPRRALEPPPLPCGLRIAPSRPPGSPWGPGRPCPAPPAPPGGPCPRGGLPLWPPCCRRNIVGGVSRVPSNATRWEGPQSAGRGGRRQAEGAPSRGRGRVRAARPPAPGRPG
jgi:hypothetical protein